MDESERLDRFAELERGLEPGPLGNKPLAPTAALQPISVGLKAAATNFLAKARKAYEDDPARARRFIERLVDVPYDEHEQIFPGVIAAHYNLYESVVEAAEALEEDDRTWLAAALEVYASTNETGREEMEDVLAVLLNEGYGTRHQRREIRALVGAVDVREVIYEDPPIGRDNQIAYIEAVLRTELEFAAAFDRLVYDS